MIYQVQTLYRNNRDDGMGFSWQSRNHCQDDLMWLLNGFAQYYKTFCSQPEKERRDFLAHDVYSQITAHKGSKDKRDRFLAGANIYLLEREGILQPDEYNGVAIMELDSKVLTTYYTLDLWLKQRAQTLRSEEFEILRMEELERRLALGYYILEENN